MVVYVVAYLKVVAGNISEWITTTATAKSTSTTSETAAKELAEDVIGIKAAGMSTMETAWATWTATYYISKDQSPFCFQ
jgi:hypothetical protein